ncbi:MAG: hypothetical protein JWM56_329 [Candidatus Peribacteria bacterium]|nr:hypothetical protein [Candidatus Peribacteria bacterium]
MLPITTCSMEKEPSSVQKTGALHKAAEKTTHWIGSVPSLIVHTILFTGSFSLVFVGVQLDHILSVVTTLVSLEAIYLAIFIQMAVNDNTASLDAVEENLDEIQEDVDEIQKDVGEIEKDIDEIQEDVDEIQEDVDEIQEDVDEIQKDDTEEEMDTKQNKLVLTKIESQLSDLLTQIEKMKSEMNMKK